MDTACDRLDFTWRLCPGHLDGLHYGLLLARAVGFPSEAGSFIEHDSNKMTQIHFLISGLHVAAVPGPPGRAASCLSCFTGAAAVAALYHKLCAMNVVFMIKVHTQRCFPWPAAGASREFLDEASSPQALWSPLMTSVDQK